MPEPERRAFSAAVATMCDVDRLAGLSAGGRSARRGGEARTAWITENVDNPDSIELRTLLSVKGAAEQAGMLRASGQGARPPALRARGHAGEDRRGRALAVAAHFRSGPKGSTGAARAAFFTAGGMAGADDDAAGDALVEGEAAG